MCPQPVVTGCDTETGHEIVRDRPYCGLPGEWCPVRLNETSERHADDEDDVQPVDVLVPVRRGDGLLGDVTLRGIVLLVTVGLGWLGHARDVLVCCHCDYMAK